MVGGELYREVWNQQWEEVESVLRVGGWLPYV